MQSSERITRARTRPRDRGSRDMASLAATHPLATRAGAAASSGLRAPRARASRRCALTTRAAATPSETASGRSRTNNVFAPSDGARRGISVVTEASKGYGFGYGYGYGFKYGHGYGEPELGGKSGTTVAPSSTAPGPASSSSASTGAAGFKEWWAKAGKIDKSTIAALGGAALLSYGLISNVFYVSSLLGAMYTSCKVHALSPLVSLFFIFVSRMGN